MKEFQEKMDKFPQYTGAVLDPRSTIQKAQDHQHAEIASAGAPVVWELKPVANIKLFPKRSQNGSSSCVAQSGVKMLGIENFAEEKTFIELSALPVYQARSNAPGEGMWQQDALSILSKPYACLEADLPSQDMTEVQMNKTAFLGPKERGDAELYRANGYVSIPVDIDQIAGIIAQGKGVQLMMFFTDQEYWKPVPGLIESTLLKDSPNSRRHGICAVDFTLYHNQKALVIEDSAGGNSTINESGQRIITEEFLKARCFGAGYLIYKENVPTGLPKPKYLFSTPLQFGMMNNGDVKVLQKILQYEGLFPSNLECTGNMLQITCGALKKWQVKHEIMDFANAIDVRTVRFGPRSMTLANKLYA